MKIKKRSLFPKCIRHFKQIKGFCIGECIRDKKLIHLAHAHCSDADPYQGWICLKYKYILKEKLTLLHEVAHLIANRSESTPFHGKLWKQVLLAIGGTFKAYSYTHNYRITTYLDYTYRSRKK